MSTPFFSIAIPSKNRPDRLEQAVRSVLDQTVQDFEIIVGDNSDEREAEATAAVVRAIGDPRIVYVRTSGRLSMPDNWEQAVAHARGAYVGILTDRSVFMPFALERARRQIEATGVPLVGWFGDSVRARAERARLPPPVAFGAGVARREPSAARLLRARAFQARVQAPAQADDRGVRAPGARFRSAGRR